MELDIQDSEFDIKEIFKIILYYKWTIVLVTVLFAIVSACWVYFKQDIYKATATVQVGLSERGYANGDIIAKAIEPGRLNADTEIAIIKSRFVAKKASETVDKSHHYFTTINYKKIELYKNAPFKVGMNKGYGLHFDFYPIDDHYYRLVLRSSGFLFDKKLPYDQEIKNNYFHLNITKVKDAKYHKYSFYIDNPNKIYTSGISVRQTSKYSTILEISSEDNVPLRAQEFANALAYAYIQQSVEKKTQEATKKLEFIDKQLKYITQNLQASAIKIEDFKRKSKAINLSAKATAVINKLSLNETKLSELSMKEELLAHIYKKIKKGHKLESMITLGLGDSEASLDAMVKKLQDAILKKKLLREDYTEMYPEVRKLTKTISQLKHLIIATIKNLQKNILEQKRLLEKEIAKQQKILESLPADERMYSQLKRKFAVNEKIYSYLLEKRSETAIIKASTVSKNRIIDEALLPSTPIKPKRKQVILIGLFIGLIVGVIIAFVRNYYNNTIKDENDITSLSKVPVVGVIPSLKTSLLDIVKKPKSLSAEAFRSIRTNLQFMSRYKGSQIIAVTSTVSSEGKSTIVANLSLIMSINNKKIIILNLDMRKPTLHTYFGISNQYGMSTLLSGNISLKEAIQKTPYQNIDLITAGPIPPNPSELIQSPYMQKILHKLKEEYDVIILDTPPIGLVTDAQNILHMVDICLYVFRGDYSKKEFVKSLNELASIDDICSLGVILNDIKLDKNHYGYGYGYYEEEH